ncbi:Uncharacterised protein [Streptococcus pneumoniae]|nr:Uncharacterised protein [Streptococcus pneumoniae]
MSNQLVTDLVCCRKVTIGTRLLAFLNQVFNLCIQNFLNKDNSKNF